jgi:GntR family transcriptional regulator, rspAB operon transcriptional repressor
VTPAEASSISLADRAYQHILQAILRGTLPVGAEVNRRRIAEELDMSVLPVAEAIQRLEREMLVESGNRVGTRVRMPTPQDIRGFCIVREALETQAARMFAERASLHERKALVNAASELDKQYERTAMLAEGASEDELYVLRLSHMQFHLRIVDTVACPYLRQQVERNQHLVFGHFYDKLFGPRRLPYQWHVSLAESLASGDPLSADDAMRRHVRHHVEEILYRLEPFLRLDRETLAASL